MGEIIKPLSFKKFFCERNDIAGDLPEKLYHATWEQNVYSIQQKGLIRCSDNAVNYDWCEREIYLARSPELAESFVENGENEQIDYDQRIVIYEIDVNSLDLDVLFKDPYFNFNPDEQFVETISFVYKKNIPAHLLKEV
jgi:hypothetical protein